MKSDIMFHVKIALLILLMLGVQCVYAVLMTLGMRSGLESSINESLGWNVGALSDNITGVLERSLADAKEWDGTDDKYADSAVIAGGAVTFVNGNTVTPDTNVLNNLSDKTFNVYRLADLDKNASSTTEGAYYLLYCFTVNGNRKLVFQTQDAFTQRTAAFGFDTPMLTAENGRILTGALAGGNLQTILNLAPSTLFGADTALVKCTYNGAAHIAAVEPTEFEGVKLYAVGFVSQVKVGATLEAQMKNSVVTILVMIGVTVLLLAVFLILFVRRDRSNRAALGTEYELFCDRRGNISKANHTFKKFFEHNNIYIDMPGGLPDDLENGTSMVLPMVDRLKKQHMISFLVAKRKDAFRLVGRDTTMQKTSDGIRSEGMQRSVDLQADFKELSKKGRLTLGVIEIINLNTIETMFGKTFCEKVYFAVSEKVKSRFDSFYAMIPDQIGVLMPDGKDSDDIMRDIAQIMDELNRPVRIEDNLINAVCRAGFAKVDETMEDSSFEYAQTAVRATLKKAIADERQFYFIYHETQKKQYLKYFEKSCDLHDMLKRDCFELEFQPQYDIATNRVSGFESLFRVKRQYTLEMTTQELIEYAERSGSMIFLGNFIFGEAMKFAKSIEGSGVTVSLNVSPVQLMQAGFVNNFLQLYREHKLRPDSICIEITETFLMNNFDETLDKLKILTKEGISVHLDDFGVSYSSLLYLKKLPINAIKIDREFISDIVENSYSRAITTFIVNITKDLHLISISEGVETESQRDVLREIGCDVVQGWLTGRSMPADSARSLVFDNIVSAPPEPSPPVNAADTKGRVKTK